MNKETSILSNFKYILVGTVFGIVFIKAEIISWFRIQEMFRFQSFHMFGVIGTAVLVGMISIQIIKRLNIKTLDGQPIQFQTKAFDKGTVIGSIFFGFGWALTGACPGPLFAHIGNGSITLIFTLLSALLGTWVYGAIKDKLPH